MSEKITQAELDVMDVLWTQSPQPATDIAAHLAERKDWSAQTVKTLLSRLVEKGAVAHEPDGRRYLYRPTLTRESYAREAAATFIDRLFDGRAAPLVANLAETGRLTDGDIAELEAMLKELKRGR